MGEEQNTLVVVTFYRRRLAAYNQRGGELQPFRGWRHLASAIHTIGKLTSNIFPP